MSGCQSVLSVPIEVAIRDSRLVSTCHAKRARNRSTTLRAETLRPKPRGWWGSWPILSPSTKDRN